VLRVLFYGFNFHTEFWKGLSFLVFFLENDLQAARAPSGNGVRQ
jgi:hypothetical protein